MEQESGESAKGADRKPRLHRNVKLLGWASFFNDVASEAIVPFLPDFVEKLGGGKGALGWIEGVADAISSLMRLFAGALSDRLGKRRGLIWLGYALPALLRPLLGLATLWWHVFFVRMGDRFGKGLRTAPRDALIADSSPADQRGYAFGFHRAMDHLGAALGPLAALVFLYFFPDHLRTLFLLTFLPGVVVTLVVVFGLKERPRPIAPTASRERFRFELRLGRHFWWYLTAVGVFSLGASTDLFLLARLRELGVEALFLPLIWCGFHVLKSYGNVWIGRWTDRIPPLRLLLAGWLLYALVYVLMGVIEGMWVGVMLFMGYAAYYALTEPPEKTLVAALAPDSARGQAFGWFHFVTGVAALPASVVFGWLYESWGAQAAFFTGAGLALAAVLVLLPMALHGGGRQLGQTGHPAGGD